jgi:4-amino-4-deoxy-L-arabinose transferase-like glycosyltransferase
MFFKFSKKQAVFVFFLLFTFFTRFYRLDWTDGFFFHPDENNMATAITGLSLSDLNPHFFAYGQFPLYLVFFTQQIFHLSGFSSAILLLRFYSAVFSCLSLFIFYQIAKILFSSSLNRLVFLLLLIFSPGLIQMAHFGTTESILFFVFSSTLFFSAKILKDSNSKKYLFLSSLVCGLGLASKITALFFCLPVILVLLLNFLKFGKIKKLFLSLFVFGLFTSIVFFVFSPYNLISLSEFLSAIKYEISVANGSLPVFYTHQFIGTIPYWFQITKILPYTSGFPVFITSLLSLIFIPFYFFSAKTSFKNNLKHQLFFIILFSSLVYFLYIGAQFVKWTRFLSPLFFLPPLLSVILLSKIKNRFFFFLLVIISLVPGFTFFRRYFSTDPRLLASRWIDEKIPANSFILSESGNIANLPLNAKNSYQIINFNFYTLDQEPENVNDLISKISQTSYLIIPSRRIFKNQNKSSFPLSQRYYQSLFSGQLGFSPIKSFVHPGGLLLDPEQAEETWTVFDNPTVRLYKKTTPLTFSDYQRLLSP